MRQKRIHQRTVMITSTRMDDHIRRLVDNQQVFIFINDIESYFLRLRFGLDGGRNRDPVLFFDTHLI